MDLVSQLVLVSLVKRTEDPNWRRYLGIYRGECPTNQTRMPEEMCVVPKANMDFGSACDVLI